MVDERESSSHCTLDKSECEVEDTGSVDLTHGSTSFHGKLTTAQWFILCATVVAIILLERCT